MRQSLELNEKGLWVRKKKMATEDLQAYIESSWSFVKAPGGPRPFRQCQAAPEGAEERRGGMEGGMFGCRIRIRRVKSGGTCGPPRCCQDPRLEAAKPRGRGTADASEKALEAASRLILQLSSKMVTFLIFSLYQTPFFGFIFTWLTHV